MAVRAGQFLQQIDAKQASQGESCQANHPAFAHAHGRVDHPGAEVHIPTQGNIDQDGGQQDLFEVANHHQSAGARGSNDHQITDFLRQAVLQHSQSANQDAGKHQQADLRQPDFGRQSSCAPDPVIQPVGNIQ